jgi:competence protein ComEA
MRGGGKGVSPTRIGVAIVAVVVAIAASYALFRALDERSAPPIVIADAAAEIPVVVDVRGAVVSPGLYELPPGARVQDVADAAGGFTGDADLSAINLARRVRDGEIVLIASLSQSLATPGDPVRPDDVGSASGAANQKININTATVAELDVLPGIGEVTAARIIAFREEHGPYRSVDDLVHVQGISTNTIAGFRDLVTIGP